MSAATKQRKFAHRKTISASCLLPLKKRFKSESQTPLVKVETEADSEEAPVDFSLPSRTRAKLLSDDMKCEDSVSSRTSPDSEQFAKIKLECDSAKAPKMAAVDLIPGTGVFGDLSNDMAVRNGLSLGLTNLLLAQMASINLPLLNCYRLAPVVKQEPIFTAGTGGQNDSEPATWEEHRSEHPFVINPATGNKVRKNYKNTTIARR